MRMPNSFRASSSGRILRAFPDRDCPMAHPAGMLFRFLTVYDQNPEGTQYRRILPLTTVGVAVDADDAGPGA